MFVSTVILLTVGITAFLLHTHDHCTLESTDDCPICNAHNLIAQNLFFISAGLCITFVLVLIRKINIFSRIFVPIVCHTPLFYRRGPPTPAFLCMNA